MKTRAPRKNPSEASAPSAEIVFVIDVSALTKEGFVGSSTYEGKQVELGFDDSGKGVYLTPEMARAFMSGRDPGCPWFWRANRPGS